MRANEMKSVTHGMTLHQRVMHVGGRENAQGYVEFGSVGAVGLLVSQVLRDMPKGAPGFDAGNAVSTASVAQFDAVPVAYEFGECGEFRIVRRSSFEDEQEAWAVLWRGMALGKSGQSSYETSPVRKTPQWAAEFLYPSAAQALAAAKRVIDGREKYGDSGE